MYTVFIKKKDFYDMFVQAGLVAYAVKNSGNNTDHTFSDIGKYIWNKRTTFVQHCTHFERIRKMKEGKRNNLSISSY